MRCGKIVIADLNVRRNVSVDGTLKDGILTSLKDGCVADNQ